MEARQEKEKREEQIRREEYSRKEEHNRREEQNRTEEERENETQRCRKKAFVRRVRQRGGGVIGLINNTARSITFTSTRFLMGRSQVCRYLMRKCDDETNEFLSGG